MVSPTIVGLQTPFVRPISDGVQSFQTDPYAILVLAFEYN